MKPIKIILISFILLSCNNGITKIYYSKKLDKCIYNLEVLENWVYEDYEKSLIPYDLAQNYTYVLQTTKYGLIKKLEKIEKKKE